jgi:hypothetical protein
MSAAACCVASSGQVEQERSGQIGGPCMHVFMHRTPASMNGWFRPATVRSGWVVYLAAWAVRMERGRRTSCAEAASGLAPTQAETSISQLLWPGGKRPASAQCSGAPAHVTSPVAGASPTRLLLTCARDSVPASGRTCAARPARGSGETVCVCRV